MYENYWGLKEKPFENTPDPRFIYYSQQHKEAIARMLYVVREHKGAALLTGEYGSGKTLLSRVLWHELQQENKFQSVFILNPRLSGLEFIQEIVHQLGLRAAHQLFLEDGVQFHRRHQVVKRLLLAFLGIPEVLLERFAARAQRRYLLAVLLGLPLALVQLRFLEVQGVRELGDLGLQARIEHVGLVILLPGPLEIVPGDRIGRGVA